MFAANLKKKKKKDRLLEENLVVLRQIFNFKGSFCLNDNYVAVLLSFKSIEMEIWIHLELDQTRDSRIYP